MAVDRNSALFRVLFRALLFMLLTGVGVSGCGKTGPLYLPDSTLVASDIKLISDSAGVAQHSALLFIN
ncbi:hypothetical protein MNBD_GAMMA09-1901 [hydrothermal vent metagenome]|uniref:Lipoprotein n=1 Tax=hydrothermal vent metagenome TaxID=652676 RepID=A0A3B0Y436_9ZZZZ